MKSYVVGFTLGATLGIIGVRLNSADFWIVLIPTLISMHVFDIVVKK